MRDHVLLLVAGRLVGPGLALLAEHPGLFEPNHNYNLARNLADARGFTNGYIWQFHQKPTDVSHPIYYWMPLAALWPALSMRLLWIGVLPALLPKILSGTALVALTGPIARAARLSRNAVLMAMALILFLPDFVPVAIRTDTTFGYALFCGLALLFLFRRMHDRPGTLVLQDALWPLYDGSESDARLPLPGRTSEFRLFGIARA